MSVLEKIDPSVREQVESWLNGNYDHETKCEIERLIEQGDPGLLTDAFYKNLEFGTGGLRGIMGVGTNRINKYTLGIATQGLSNYLKMVYGNEEQIKVVIAHDSRNNAEQFASIVADVFSANGFKVYFFESLRPTPELSYAIRELGCKSGVMLTASHNPKEYSGYKAYWDDGCQVLPPHDKRIIEEVNKIDSIDQVRFEGNQELIETIGEEMDQKYIERVAAESLYPELIENQKEMGIVFSPIHGTAVDIVPRALKKIGFENVILVEEQCTPDGDFPTVVYPNPEEREALTLALKKAEETGAELVMATDPDADRVGIAVKNEQGELELLNGNQTAVLIFGFLLHAWEEKGMLQGNEYIVKTIVTSYLIDKIAKSKAVQCYNTLTGFKYIGALMTELEGREKFIAGGEESYGYLIGDHVRDKDAVVSSTVIAEMAAYYKEQGLTLFDALLDIYTKYGFYKEELISLKKEGKSGAEEIQKIMAELRKNPPASFAGQEVVTVKDYQSLTEKDLKSGTETELDFPKSNVLQFVTEGGYLVSARPSGTEPKIKFYISVNTRLNSPEEFRSVESRLDQVIQQIKGELDF
jgi:phosphoglucomutase